VREHEIIENFERESLARGRHPCGSLCHWSGIRGAVDSANHERN
jgi:hypothetical protein